MGRFARLIFLLLLFCSSIASVGGASDKAATRLILEQNKEAIETNLKIIEEYPDETQWFFAVNTHGMLTVLPMSHQNWIVYQQEYKRLMSEARWQAFLDGADMEYYHSIGAKNARKSG